MYNYTKDQDANDIELETIKITDSYNLNSKELKKLRTLVKENSEILTKAWNEYFKQ